MLANNIHNSLTSLLLKFQLENLSSELNQVTLARNEEELVRRASNTSFVSFDIMQISDPERIILVPIILRLAFALIQYLKSEMFIQSEMFILLICRSLKLN